MQDGCGRTIDYLRLSVTDRCNYRCQYCMPPEGVEKRLHSDILSIKELAEIAEAAVACGVKKIRLTGGEPLVRRGLLDLCRMLRAIPGVEELCLTTNGSLLPQLARCGSGPAEHQPGHPASGPVCRHDPAGDPPGCAGRHRSRGGGGIP